LSWGAVADFVVRPSDREIQRVDRLTTAVVSANVAKGATLDEIRKRVEPIMNDYPLPAGYSWKFGRGFEENDKAIQTMSQNLILAVVLIFLVMASLFESTLYPLSIITSILFAIVGAIWFLALTGTTITMMAMIGFMILVGVVVNIGIVLIAHVIDLRAGGLSREAAILQAGRDRLRPILMTTDDDAARHDAARRRRCSRRRRWAAKALPITRWRGRSSAGWDSRPESRCWSCRCSTSGSTTCICGRSGFFHRERSR
jgi:HAE1 family hydrophobic/amphiphilic exporter-1